MAVHRRRKQRRRRSPGIDPKLGVKEPQERARWQPARRRHLLRCRRGPCRLMCECVCLWRWRWRRRRRRRRNNTLASCRCRRHNLEPSKSNVHLECAYRLIQRVWCEWHFRSRTLVLYHVFILRSEWVMQERMNILHPPCSTDREPMQICMYTPREALGRWIGGEMLFSV